MEMSLKCGLDSTLGHMPFLNLLDGGNLLRHHCSAWPIRPRLSDRICPDSRKGCLADFHILVTRA